MDEKLQRRVSVTAQRLGQSESEVIREAIDQFCDDDSEPNVADALGGFVGCISTSTGFEAERARDVFGDMLEEDWRRQKLGLSRLDREASGWWNRQRSSDPD